MSNNTIEITSENFDDKVLNSQKPVLLDFWASWCGPCKMLAPVFEQAAAENPDVVFGKINIDEQDSLASKYKVMSIPTLIYIKNGEVQSKSVGFVTKEQIEQIIL